MGDRAVSAADYPRQSNLPISIARGQVIWSGVGTRASLNEVTIDLHVMAGGWDIHRHSGDEVYCTCTVRSSGTAEGVVLVTIWRPKKKTALGSTRQHSKQHIFATRLTR